MGRDMLHFRHHAEADDNTLRDPADSSSAYVDPVANSQFKKVRSRASKTKPGKIRVSLQRQHLSLRRLHPKSCRMGVTSQQLKRQRSPEQVTDRQRDWLDYLALCINSILACVGVAGVIAAWRGLPGIARQAKASEDAANAAKESAEAALKQANIAINADRAWVFVSVAIWKFIGEDQGDETLYHAKVTIELENFGKAPAFSISARCGASFAESLYKIDDESIFDSIEDAYQIGDVERLPFPPGRLAKVIEVTSPDSLDKEEWHKFVNVGEYWYRPPIAYGVIRYRDAYDNERTTKFCLARWNDGARIVGSPGMNSYT